MNEPVFCPNCDVEMSHRESRYGPYLVCFNYPKCNTKVGCHPDGTPKGVAPHGRIRKRAETDKQNVERWVPMSRAVRKAADLVLSRRQVAGDMWLFPAPRNPSKPWSRHHARKIHNRAYEKAKLPTKGFHAFRRKWVTERKHHPRSDVARAGDWKTERTLAIYESPDDETTLRVMEEPRRLRDAK